MNAPQDEQSETSLYRSRRLIDAVRFLPWVALIFFILPALLVPEPQARATSTSASLIYFIGCWFILIVAAFAISRALSRRCPDDLPFEPDPPGPGGTPPW